MSTQVADQEFTGRRSEQRTTSWAETKPSFLTTEFYAMVGVIVATIVAGQANHSWHDRWVWQVVAAIAIGYMVSRGLAKSGSADRRDNG
jgi:putative flippase GtrA